MNFKAIILATFLMIAALTSYAGSLSFADLEATPVSGEKDGVVIKGFHYRQKGVAPNQKRPLIMTHGLSSTLHEFEFLIATMVEAGFECFAYNWRGHGNGDERSVVLNYKEGDYDFENLARVDFPLMLEITKQYNSAKPHILGHSMGGMGPRASLIMGSTKASQIESMILFGSPAHFRNENSKSTLYGAKGILEAYLFSGSGQEPALKMGMAKTAMKISDTVNLLNPFYWVAKGAIQHEMSYRMSQEMGFSESMNANDSWSQRAMGNPTKDIMRSFAGFQKYYKYDAEMTENKIKGVPIFHIVGRKDTLAPAADIINSAKVQSSEAGFWVAMVDEMGHLGLVAPWVLEGVKEHMFDFLSHSKKELASKMNQRYIQFTPKQVRANGTSAVRCYNLLEKI